MVNLALPTAFGAFCAWCVYMGALASLQSMCPEAPAVFASTFGSPGTSCSGVFRWWWFLLSIEFFLVFLVGLLAIQKKLDNARIAIAGLAAVCALLFIEASNETLDMLNNINLGIFQPQNGYGYYRLRTLAAGSICVAGFNCIMILAAGIVSSDSEIAAKQATQAV